MTRVLTLILLSAALFFTACGSDQNAAPTDLTPNSVPTVSNLGAPVTFVGTQSPGHLWTITVTNQTFSAQDKTNGLTYSGTVVTLPSGFLRFTTTSTNDASIAAPFNTFGVLANGSLLAFEPPAASQSQEPASFGTNLVVGVPIGSCPVDNVSIDFNGVAMTNSNWTSSDSAYTRFTNMLNDGSLSEPYVDFNLNGDQTDADTPLYDCSGGVFANLDATLAPSPDQLANIIDLGGDSRTLSGFVDLAAPSADLSINELASLSYDGFTSSVHLGGDGSGTENAISATPAGGDALVAGAVDPSSGALVGSAGTIAFTGQLSPGILSATINNSFAAVFVANQLGGRFILVGIYFDSDNNQSKNIVLVEN